MFPIVYYKKIKSDNLIICPLYNQINVLIFMPNVNDEVIQLGAKYLHFLYYQTCAVSVYLKIEVIIIYAHS